MDYVAYKISDQMKYTIATFPRGTGENYEEPQS